jgi:hypothetical protein
MATKKEIFNQAMALCKEHKAPEGLVTAITAILEPKKGGQVVDIESMVKRNGEGKIVQIKCKLSGKFLPADPANFFTDKNSKLDGLYPVSKMADKLRKAAVAAFKASKEAITMDVLDGKIAPAAGKAKLAELQKSVNNVDYSTVKPYVAPAPEAK